MSLSHVSLGEPFKEGRENFITINDISRHTNLRVMITTLYFKRQFDTINRGKIVQNQISGCFEIFSFSNGSRTKHFKQVRDNFATNNDI